MSDVNIGVKVDVYKSINNEFKLYDLGEIIKSIEVPMGTDCFGRKKVEQIYIVKGEKDTYEIMNILFQSSGYIMVVRK